MCSCTDNATSSAPSVECPPDLLVPVNFTADSEPVPPTPAPLPGPPGPRGLQGPPGPVGPPV